MNNIASINTAIARLAGDCFDRIFSVRLSDGSTDEYPARIDPDRATRDQVLDQLNHENRRRHPGRYTTVIAFNCNPA